MRMFIKPCRLCRRPIPAERIHWHVSAKAADIAALIGLGRRRCAINRRRSSAYFFVFLRHAAVFMHIRRYFPPLVFISSYLEGEKSAISAHCLRLHSHIEQCCTTWFVNSEGAGVGPMDTEQRSSLSSRKSAVNVCAVTNAALHVHDKYWHRG